MSVYEIEYADAFGHHAEAVDGWDQEHAVKSWRANHSGERVHLLDVSRIGSAEEVEVGA